MEKTKANIRRLRETMGLTQVEMANLFGVQKRSARRWETPQATQNNMPDVAWFQLVQIYEQFQNDANYAAEKLLEFAENEKGGKAVVMYYRNQEDLDSVQGDRGRLVGYVNALTRQAAFLCENAGLDITARYYAEDDDDVEGVREFIIADKL
jgi:transcriptional regulator with XRE-family HTH domain